MKNTRLKQFGISFLVVLSLFVSSISACACSHHQEKVETSNSSCHQQDHSVKTENKTESAENFENIVSEGDCYCVQSAPRFVSKDERFKITKQLAEIVPKSEIDFKEILPIVEVKKIDFVTPFYLSDSFYNIPNSRGPPRL